MIDSEPRIKKIEPMVTAGMDSTVTAVCTP